MTSKKKGLYSNLVRLFAQSWVQACSNLLPYLQRGGGGRAWPNGPPKYAPDYNHLQSFKHRHKASATKLSKYIWKCKDAGLNPAVSWEIVRHAPAYNSGNRVCQLCLQKKHQILLSNYANPFYKRSEVIIKYRRRTKFKLKNIKRNATKTSISLHSVVFNPFFSSPTNFSRL